MSSHVGGDIWKADVKGPLSPGRLSEAIKCHRGRSQLLGELVQLRNCDWNKGEPTRILNISSNPSTM